MQVDVQSQQISQINPEKDLNVQVKEQFFNKSHSIYKKVTAGGLDGMKFNKNIKNAGRKYKKYEA